MICSWTLQSQTSSIHPCAAYQLKLCWSLSQSFTGQAARPKHSCSVFNPSEAFCLVRFKGWDQKKTYKNDGKSGNRIWQSILTSPMNGNGLQFRLPGPFWGRFRSYGVAWKLRKRCLRLCDLGDELIPPQFWQPKIWGHVRLHWSALHDIACKSMAHHRLKEPSIIIWIYHHLSSCVWNCMSGTSSRPESSHHMILYSSYHMCHMSRKWQIITGCRRRRTSSPARHHRLRRPVRASALCQGDGFIMIYNIL